MALEAESAVWPVTSRFRPLPDPRASGTFSFYASLTSICLALKGRTGWKLRDFFQYQIPGSTCACNKKGSTLDPRRQADLPWYRIKHMPFLHESKVDPSLMHAHAEFDPNYLDLVLNVKTAGRSTPCIEEVENAPGPILLD